MDSMGAKPLLPLRRERARVRTKGVQAHQEGRSAGLEDAGSKPAIITIGTDDGA
jgi:hypothetical protein